jgi:hypothetical protein
MPVTIVGMDALLARLAALGDASAAMGRSSVQLGASAPYAPYIEYGTQPHEISPVNKRALFWPGAEHPVMHVHHPGTKANPVLWNALVSTEPMVREIIAAALVGIGDGEPASAGMAALETAGRALEQTARERAPVKTGTYRDGIHAIVMARL